MANKFKEENIIPEEKSNDGFRKINHQATCAITKTIGKGKEAQNSLVYLTLKYAFISGVIISVLVIANHWMFRTEDNKVPDFIGDVKVTWEIIIPLITLALGYAFGKSEDQTK